MLFETYSLNAQGCNMVRLFLSSGATGCSTVQASRLRIAVWGWVWEVSPSYVKHESLRQEAHFLYIFATSNNATNYLG